jgi:hypothetical protein
VLFSLPSLALLILSAFADNCERYVDIYEQVEFENCVTIVNSRFEALEPGGYSSYGGAIDLTYYDDESASTISGCTFRECIVTGGGGGIAAGCSCFLIRFCYAVQCTGFYHAGFMSLTGGTIHPDTLSQLSIWDCGAARGGGIRFSGSETSAGDSVNCTECSAINWGAAIQWDGDGVYYVDYPRALRYSIFSANKNFAFTATLHFEYRCISDPDTG